MKAVEMVTSGLLFLTLLGEPTQQAAQVANIKASKSNAPVDEVKFEVLSELQGVDVQHYLLNAITKVRTNWYLLIPEKARRPELKTGQVTIEFAILKDGKVMGMKFVSNSGDSSLDRAAWDSIVASVPFAPLPAQFHGPNLTLRSQFRYNLP